MDWVTRMNAAVTLIEQGLDSEMDLEKAAQAAGCSLYHFTRVFSYMANVTLGEYIRRRRLTLAAFELQRGEQKVIDVALKYGYDSPTSFTRAFSQMHGVPPSKASEPGVGLTSFLPISFQISIKGVTAMNYKMMEMDAFTVVGYKMHTTMKDEQGLKDIPAFWAKAHQSGDMKKLFPLMGKEPLGVFGLCAGGTEYGAEFDYYIAVTSDAPAPAGMSSYTVPKSTWAVFECRGPMPKSIQDVTRRVYQEWLPTSGYEYGDGPDIEVYSDGDTKGSDYLCWLWLPVRKK